jgi:hypothetical protein
MCASCKTAHKACSWGSVIPPCFNSMKVSFHANVPHCGSPLNVTVEDPGNQGGDADFEAVVEEPLKDRSTDSYGDLSDDPGSEAIVEDRAEGEPVSGSDPPLDYLCLRRYQGAILAGLATALSEIGRMEEEQVHQMVEAMSKTGVE